MPLRWKVITQLRSARLMPFLGAVAAVLTFAGPAALAPTPAAAQAASCKDDIDKLAKRRLAAIADIDHIAKAGKGKLDPMAACPKLRNLAVLEGELANYFVKNKDWCEIPDSAIEAISSAHGKTIKVAGQACGLAAQAKKMQQQQAAQGGPLGAPEAPKLPTGPL